ncbi:hypothetical protein ACTFQ6_06000 [Aliivibrio fischeri]
MFYLSDLLFHVIEFV